MAFLGTAGVMYPISKVLSALAVVLMIWAVTVYVLATTPTGGPLGAP